MRWLWKRQKIILIKVPENTVQQKIQDFMETYGEVNEIMAISYIYDKDMQLDFIVGSIIYKSDK